MNPRSMTLRHLARARSPLRVPALRGRHSSRAARFAWTAPRATYVICTTPRSGSWLLSDGLSSTGVAGRPREWFNVLEEQQHYARWRMAHDTDLGFHRYLQLARLHSTTRNGISGIKLHYYQFAGLPDRFSLFPGLRGLTPDQLLTRLFPNSKYIWLTRRDKVRQAVSFLLASTTDVWWNVAGTPSGRRAASDREPTFDAAAIERMVRVFTRNDARWQNVFENHGIEPYVVQYDDLAADYEGSIAGVLRWLGVPDADAVTIPAARLERQSDARNEQWAARYEAERSESPPATPEPDTSVDPQRARIRRLFATIPPAWRQWIVQSKRRAVPDDEIVSVLTRHGYSRGIARSEIERLTAG